MRIEDRIKSDYFEWMYELVCGTYSVDPDFSFRRLLTTLHDTEFTYFIPHDENRAEDGMALRYRYCVRHGCEELEWCLDGPCSVLEMMLALAIRCEETIMDDPGIGDRVTQWFWGMITNMGLGGMYDSNFNEYLVDEIIMTFLNREYEPDGRGGLFRVRNWDRDMRSTEIWHQLLAYLNTLV